MSLCKGEKEADAAADQLASISLTGSDGATTAAADSENKETKSNSTVVIEKFCSNCGEAGVANTDLKLCNSCKCVWYCGAACQKAHWKEHKEECKEIREVLEGQASGKYQLKESGEAVASESLMHAASLYKNLPPREICEICMLPMPLEPNRISVGSCCGKQHCGGCGWANERQTMIENEKRRKRSLSLLKHSCPFCRTEVKDLGHEGESKELFKMLQERAETHDAVAMRSLAFEYAHRGYEYAPDCSGNGKEVEQDNEKALDLFQRASDLGDIGACAELGQAYQFGTFGLHIDECIARRYYEKAARGGECNSIFNLGVHESKEGNHDAAIYHWKVAAALGHFKSTKNLVKSFQYGDISHCDLAESLQARDKARAEMKSQNRDAYVQWMRISGYDCEPW